MLFSVFNAGFIRISGRLHAPIHEQVDAELLLVDSLALDPFRGLGFVFLRFSPLFESCPFVEFNEAEPESIPDVALQLIRQFVQPDTSNSSSVNEKKGKK